MKFHAFLSMWSWHLPVDPHTRT